MGYLAPRLSPICHGRPRTPTCSHGPGPWRLCKRWLGTSSLVWCAALFCTYREAAASAALARVTLARMSEALVRGSTPGFCIRPPEHADIGWAGKSQTTAMAVRVHRCHIVSSGALAELRLENGRLLVERRRRASGHGAVDPQSLDTSSPGKRVLRLNQKNSKSLISLEKNPSVQVLRREALLSRRLRRCWIFKIRRQQRFAAGHCCVACSTRRTSRRLAAPGRRSRSSASSPARACP